MLAKSNSLISLHLCDNSLEGAGITALSKALTHNTSVARLSLSSTGLQGSEVKSLMSMLHVNHTLTELNLCKNRLQAGGAGMLARALQFNRGLQELNLAHNRVGDEGITALAFSLKDNETLVSLDIHHNRSRAHSHPAVWPRFGQNTSLLSLKYDRNSVTKHTERELTACLRRNAQNRVVQSKLALLMGLHPTAGADSPLYTAFQASPIGDLRILQRVFDLLWPQELQQPLQQSQSEQEAQRERQVAGILEAGMQLKLSELENAQGHGVELEDGAATDYHLDSSNPVSTSKQRSMRGSHRFRAFLTGLVTTPRSLGSDAAVVRTGEKPFSPLSPLSPEPVEPPSAGTYSVMSGMHAGEGEVDMGIAVGQGGEGSGFDFGSDSDGLGEDNKMPRVWKSGPLLEEEEKEEGPALITSSPCSSSSSSGLPGPSPETLGVEAKEDSMLASGSGMTKPKEGASDGASEVGFMGRLHTAHMTGSGGGRKGSTPLPSGTGAVLHSVIGRAAQGPVAGPLKQTISTLFRRNSGST